MIINTQQQVLWHAPQWLQMSRMLAQDRFPHALLMEGMRGVGKRVFAYQLAQMLLCQGSDSDSGICQVCPSCEWFLSDTHPDFVVLQPEEGKKLISVDTVRQSSQQVFKTSHQNGYRILVIEPADAMTTEAANSLLKTLEEPPAQTLLILITDKPARLLPTIRSRATRLQFQLPATEHAIAWLIEQGLSIDKARGILALSLGAPMRLDLDIEQVDNILSECRNWWLEWQSLFGPDADPVRTAKGWSQSDPGLFLTWLESLLRSLIELAMHAGDRQSVQNENFTSMLYPGLERFIGKFNYSTLFRLRDNVVELSQRQQTSLNWGLQLEALACDYQVLN